MTVVERLEAAIAKLERLRESEPYHESHSWLVSLITVGTEDDRREEEAPQTSSELIVTLHRTIDAQIAVLRVGSEFALITSNRWTDISVALADAILGDDYTLTTEEAKL